MQRNACQSCKRNNCEVIPQNNACSIAVSLVHIAIEEIKKAKTQRTIAALEYAENAYKLLRSAREVAIKDCDLHKQKFQEKCEKALEEIVVLQVLIVTQDAEIAALILFLQL